MKAVIPFGYSNDPQRSALLETVVERFVEYGFDPVVVEGSASCGAGWRSGLDRCADDDLVLLAADDAEIRRGSSLEEAIDLARRGFVVSPTLWNPDGTLQGAGGYKQTFRHGDVAGNCCFPFARRDMFEGFWPWPATGHYCDVWISEAARRAYLGPFVDHRFALVHHHFNFETEDGRREYESWREERLAPAR